MNKDEALRLALEAAYLAGFNDSAEGYNSEYPFRDHGVTPTSDRRWVERRNEYIKQALEKTQGVFPEQEFVAYTVAGQVRDWSKDFSAYKTQHYVRPVYTSTSKREPLTGEQMRLLADKHLLYQLERYEISGVFTLIRATEAAHGIKGEA